MKRIYHRWDEWECYPAGFYENRPQNKALTDDDCRQLYRELLSDVLRFREALGDVVDQWPASTEHYLSNERMNRIAWLGQAALCLAEGVPSRFRGGYMLLSEAEKAAADDVALEALNAWLVARGEEPTDLVGAGTRAKVNLY